MLPWMDPNQAQPYALPYDTSTPRTLFWFRPATSERWATVIAAQERRRDVGLAAGGKDHDPELRAAISAAHVEAFSQLCVKIENAPGSEGPRTITDPGEIHTFLRTLPSTWYALLTQQVTSAQMVSDAEGKASASPSTSAD